MGCKVAPNVGGFDMKMLWWLGYDDEDDVDIDLGVGEFANMCDSFTVATISFDLTLHIFSYIYPTFGQ